MSQIEQVQVAVLGLGQVGLSLARALSSRLPTLGIDLDAARLSAVRGEIGEQQASASLWLDSAFTHLMHCDTVFLALPTTLGAQGVPDLSALVSGCERIAPHLKLSAIVVVESTVYPGATEELIIPAIEQASGKVWKKDFFVAYSPERINPGDSEHTLQTIPKVVAADCVETLDRVAAIYETVIPAGVHKVSSIRAAEMTKVVENAQRDLNIAFVNELSMLCHRLDLDTQEVLTAAKTKWNFAHFSPGLVGGECLALASQLFAHRAQEFGLQGAASTAARHVNDKMLDFVLDEFNLVLSRHGLDDPARVAVLGCSFKADVSQIAHSKAMELIFRLRGDGHQVFVHDPMVDADQLSDVATCFELSDPPVGLDVLMFAVNHAAYRQQPAKALLSRFELRGPVMDLTGALNRQAIESLGKPFWQI